MYFDTNYKLAQEKAQDKAGDAVDHLKETGQSAKKGIEHAADATKEIKMKIFFPFGFYFALLFCGINAELGIDIKEKHCKIADQVDWTCLENEGQNKFITIEAYHRGLNKHLNNCLENIPRKTIQTFDLLITLCPNCKHHPEDGPKQIIKRVNKAIQDHDIFTIFLGVHCMNTSHCNCDSKTNCGWEEDSEKGHKSNIIYLSK